MPRTIPGHDAACPYCGRVYEATDNDSFEGSTQEQVLSNDRYEIAFELCLCGAPFAIWVTDHKKGASVYVADNRPL